MQRALLYGDGTYSGLPDNAADVLICVKSFFAVPANRKNRIRAVILAAGFVITCAVAAEVYAPKKAQAANFWESLPRVTRAERAESKAELTAAEPVYVESSYTIAAPFVTVTVDAPELFVGESVVLSEGAEGTRKITERVGYSGGKEVSRAAIESNIIVQPIDEIIAVGTDPRPITTSHGEYYRPADGGITSGFGSRSVEIGSSNHRGIDIDGKNGDPIYAADGGVVLSADSKSSGYGNMVRILHDNGDVTAYAHNSELLVSEGDLVYRGQQIAKMGSTGSSSGVHCHFELLIDGKHVDPAKYLPE